jgi:ankyrin repeat protein
MSLELICAASNGDLELIHIMLNPNTELNQLLLQAGRFPDVNYHEKTYGNTALHCAVQ